jgi:hypothetical protein
MLLALNDENTIAQDLADAEPSICGLLIDGCIHQDVVQRLGVGREEPRYLKKPFSFG